MSRLTAVALLLAACATPTPPGTDIRGTVVRVDDGDGFRVRLDGREGRARLIGLNAPEHDECHGEQARAALHDLVGGREVGLAFDVERTDQYGRQLAYATVGEVLVNEALVRRGHALAVSYPPNTTHDQALAAAEEAARTSGTGLWAACRSPRAGAVEIAGVRADPPGPDHEHLDGEWVELENPG
ncbi:MAG: thermonuclease family protein, partial [Acidimicrobiia bacterium]